MRSRVVPAAVAALATAAAVTVAGLAPAGAAPPPRAAGRVVAVTPATATGRTEGARAATSRLAQSDPELLARTDAALVPVVIKLDYDSLATYQGGTDGLPATSPSVTGRALTDGTARSSPYARHVAAREADIAAAITDAVPEARIGRRLRVVYGGVSALVPADRVRDVAAVPGVVAVQADTAHQPLTDASTEFIGAPAIWDRVGGQATAGEGILFGSLDSGLWPEHPSFAPNPDLPPRPTRPDGRALECDFGDDPTTPATDVYECGNKLVGGRAFLDTYLLVNADLDEVYPDSARDSNGHGTHTATTAAGGVVDEAPVFGVDRGPISGVAPGAWVMGYKVCGAQGCYESDTSAAVEAAILDGVDVINYSISGGTNPFGDATELAFLDAYAAGVYVSTSAGNEGPGAATANHLSPWTTSVAASTQRREFGSTLTLAAGDATFAAEGVSIGSGVDDDLPVVLATDVPGYDDPLCAEEPDSADQFDGLIVACQRGNPVGRVASGFTIHSGGGEGMVLFNPTLADVETDNHWLPVIHLADGTDLKAFLEAHDGVTGHFTAGAPRDGVADAMAAFSSRGPAGPFLKPDVTAPGVQILAGHTPTPESIVEGPPGELFQAIAGTSMSAPHVAGSGILLLAEHPDWTPGQIRSALMTTATTDLVEEDLETPADPYAMGAGRIDLAAARDPGLTLDETARDFLTLTADPVASLDLNIPSVNAPLMPGAVTTTRTVTNVGGSTATYRVTATAGEGSTITVTPRHFTVAAGASRTLTVTIESTNAEGQEFGEIRLAATGRRTLHLPVAFAPRQGGAAVTSECDDDEVAVGEATTCTVTATNESFGPTTVEATTTTNDRLRVEGDATLAPTELAGREPGVPGTEPLGFDGYLSLGGLGVPATPIGDEEAVNFSTDPYVYNGLPYDGVGVVSNGYLLAGGASGSSDVQCCPPQELPDVLPPNNVLAPFWSDLDGTEAAGVYAATLTFDNGDRYFVVEWQVDAYGTDELKVFQVWIGLQDAQDISFSYPPGDVPDLTGLDEPLVVGAENETGQGGSSTVDVAPTEDLAVVSTDATPGDSVSYDVEVRGRAAGAGEVRTDLTATGLPGTTVVRTPITVTGPEVGEVEAFVDRAYQDLLGRPAEPAAATYWADRIRTGSLTRTGLALRLARGPEWLGGVVDGRYEQVLGHGPDAAGRQYWVDQLAAGTSERLLVAQLLGSAEAFDRADRELPAFVDQVYLTLLDRLADDAGRAWWIGRLEGGLTRARMGSQVFSTAEVRRLRVTALVEHLLDRAPTADELATWSEALRTRTDLAVTAEIIGSDAYFAGA